MKGKENSFIGNKFPTPSGGVLTVVKGLPRNKGKDTKYVLDCTLCSRDTELFPEGFSCTKNHILNGKVPCGCSPIPK